MRKAGGVGRGLRRLEGIEEGALVVLGRGGGEKGTTRPASGCSFVLDSLEEMKAPTKDAIDDDDEDSGLSCFSAPSERLSIESARRWGGTSCEVGSGLTLRDARGRRRGGGLNIGSSSLGKTRAMGGGR